MTQEQSNRNGPQIPDRSRRAILAFSGALTFENCFELKQAVSDEIRRKRPEVILDLKHATCMDSAVLELLVDLGDQMRAQGMTLKLIGLTKLCRDILLVTRTVNCLNVYQDLHEAITNSQ